MSESTLVQIKATEKAYKLRRGVTNDNKLAEKLNISKVTLYTRFKKSNWKPQEILLIEYYSNDEFKKFVEDLNIIECFA
jgi:hypothetical protein